MAPTGIYVKPVLALLQQVPVNGIAHITGGGLLENVPRVLPDQMCAVQEKSRWQRPALFDWLQHEGNVAENEMHRLFNCGIGMIIVVNKQDAAQAIALLQQHGETVWAIGGIERRATGGTQTIVV